MSEPLEQVDLRIPADCKKFLKDITVDGRRVTGVKLANGAWLEIDDMSDEQLIRYANDLYFDLFGGKDEGGPVDTDIVTPKGRLN